MPIGAPVETRPSRDFPTSGADILVKQFIASGDRTRNEPLSSEIEGHRVAVWHWPRHAK